MNKNKEVPYDNSTEEDLIYNNDIQDIIGRTATWLNWFSFIQSVIIIFLFFFLLNTIEGKNKKLIDIIIGPMKSYLYLKIENRETFQQ